MEEQQDLGYFQFFQIKKLISLLHLYFYGKFITLFTYFQLIILFFPLFFYFLK